MANDSDESRGHGIEFGALIDALEDESYPISRETLLDQHGDIELGLFDSQVPLREILTQEQAKEFDDEESVRQAVLTMVGGEAVGREGYSDRGGNATDEEEGDDSESF